MLHYIFTLYRRYIWMIEQSDNFIKDLNEKHATIKFKFEISQKQVNYLDTTVYIAENKELKMILYTKKMDTHNYLHRNSVHPETLKKAIPYGQARRVRRICTTS